MQTALDIIIIVLLVIAVVMLGIVILNQLKKHRTTATVKNLKDLSKLSVTNNRHCDRSLLHQLKCQ